MRVCAFCALRLFVSTCLVVPCACCFLMLASLAGWLHSSLGGNSIAPTYQCPYARCRVTAAHVSLLSMRLLQMTRFVLAPTFEQLR